MPISTDEVRKELRTQRHDFIKEYYKMAVTDLDRHIKGSWQTIVTVAATVATISLAEDNKLPVPIAVAASLGVGFWGLCNLIDGNFWSLRAIAFLANVEAVYFTEEDRKHFNPYVGHHPGYHLLDSLRYQFAAVVLFLFISIAYFIWRAFDKGLSEFIARVSNSSIEAFVFWLLPWFIVVLGIVYTLHTWRMCLGKYLSFVTDSPGPGMQTNLPIKRSVEFETSENNVPITSGEKVQEQLRNGLRQRTSDWQNYFFRAWLAAGFGFLFLCLILLSIRFGWFVP
jgi:hypothetical protein